MLRPIHIAALVGVNLIFSGAYLAGKTGVSHFPPLFFSALRFALVFIALLPFFRWRPVAPASYKPFFGFCLSMGIGVYGAMYLALAAAGGVSAILIGTQFSVPIAALLSIWMLGAKISAVTWGGIVMAFAGVMIVGFDEALLGYGGAFALILVSAFFYACANVQSKQLGGVVNVLNLNAWMALLSAPLMLAISLVFEDGQRASLGSADSVAWLSLIYSALVVSLIGHVGMFALMRRYPVAAVMPYYVLMPIFGVIGSLILFDEQPSVKFYLGGVIALIGVWIVHALGERPPPPALLRLMNHIAAGRRRK